MGTFDTYSGEVACPSCGDVHFIDGQTKFFDPFGVMRWFQPGDPQPVEVKPADLDGLAGDDWWRLRDRPPSERFTLLADFDDMYECDCGLALAPLLHFELGEGTVTLERIELLDARSEFAERVDFADAGPMWQGNLELTRTVLPKLATSSMSERAATLRKCLDAVFSAPPTEHDDTWTTLVGPMQCEACGHVRERQDSTLLTHPSALVSFFGPGWTGGVIFLGGRVPFDDAWLAEDVDAPFYLRVRHPVGNPLAILGHRRVHGCRCGAGRARVLARFARHPGQLELVELTLRVITSRADLEGIDFIEGQTRGRTDGTLRTREQVLSWILS